MRRALLLLVIAAFATSRAQATPAAGTAAGTPSGTSGTPASTAADTLSDITSGTASHPIAALAPAGDARKAVVIGAGGEVYEPDGKGAWVHRLQSSTAGALVAAGRTGGGSIVALGGGVVYRLAANGWSAIRLVQHGKAILGTGVRSLAAVGRQLFALDSLTGGEPTKLALAPANILAIGAGAKAIVLVTEAGAFKLVGAKLVALPTAPKRMRLVSDHWAIVDRGAVDLTSAALTSWPSGVTIGVAAATPDDALVAIGTSRAGLELVTLRRGKLARDPLGITGTAVDVTVDRAGRAVVALSDGRIALRSTTGWTTTQVTDEPPAEHPGPAPATPP